MITLSQPTPDQYGLDAAAHELTKAGIAQTDLAHAAAAVIALAQAR